MHPNITNISFVLQLYSNMPSLNIKYALNLKVFEQVLHS